MRNLVAIMAVILVFGGSVATAEPLDAFRELQQATRATAAQQTQIKMLQSQPGTGSIYVGRFAAATIRAAAVGTQIRLNLRPDLVVLSRTIATEVIDGRFAWRGEILNSKSGAPPAHATLIVDGESVTGTVPTPSGRVFRLYPLTGGATAIVELNYATLPPEEPPQTGGRTEVQPNERRASADAPDSNVTDLIRMLEGSQSAYRRMQAPSEASPGQAFSVDMFEWLRKLFELIRKFFEERTIDVMVVYTPSAATASGNIGSLATLAMTETNDSFINSGVWARLRSAGMMAVTYNDSQSYTTMISNLANPTDGIIDGVHTQRDTLKADVVVLVVNNPAYCGIAKNIAVGANEAFAIVHWSCATGYYSFGHEIGHLVGTRHDSDSDGSTSPYSWGHGFRRKTGTTGWRTIMGYACPSNLCNTRIQYWSTPLKTYLGNTMGSTTLEDNVRVWNDRAKTVAAFR